MFDILPSAYGQEKGDSRRVELFCVEMIQFLPAMLWFVCLYICYVPVGKLYSTCPFIDKTKHYCVFGLYHVRLHANCCVGLFMLYSSGNENRPFPRSPVVICLQKNHICNDHSNMFQKLTGIRKRAVSFLCIKMYRWFPHSTQCLMKANYS